MVKCGVKRLGGRVSEMQKTGNASHRRREEEIDLGPRQFVSARPTTADP